jgi:hypothetical protein
LSTDQISRPSAIVLYQHGDTSFSRSNFARV